MAEYGISYMGSKDGICEEIIKRFSKAENFYDLFGGGFAITHAMLLRRLKDYKRFFFNEIKSELVELIKDAICGNYNYDVFKPNFISSDEFKTRSDMYCKIIWSFGNNGRNYLFSRKIEQYKKSMHNAIVFNEFDELAEKTIGMKRFNDSYSIQQRRLFLSNRIEFFRKTKIPEFLIQFLNEKQKEKLKEIDNLVQLERLQQLERLERLQQLERLERLELTSMSYEKVNILPNSIIYCDPPYNNTAGYDNGFNHADFLNWADSQSQPVFISEYKINDNRFKEIFNIKKRSLLSNKNNIDKIERLYVNKAALSLI